MKLTLLLSFWFVAQGVLLAWSALPAATPWAAIVADLSATGLLGWYVYYDKKHGQPRLEQKHAKQLEAVIESHQAELANVRDDSQKQLERQAGYYEWTIEQLKPARPAS